MEITTPRLHIRDLREADWPGLHALRTHPAVYRYNHFGPETTEETRTWIGETMVHNNLTPRLSHNCSIVLRDSNQVIGWIGFGAPSEAHQEWGDLDFGYALLPEYWNQGYTSEATQALLDFAFTLTDANSIYATCDVRNPGSARVMEKVGMRRVARYADGNDRSGAPMESYRYQILRSEWIANKGNGLVEIHPVTPADVTFLAANFPDHVGAKKHGERLHRQAAGPAVYLIAHHAGLPIGHGLLKWGGSTDEHIASRLQGACPDAA